MTEAIGREVREFLVRYGATARLESLPSLSDESLERGDPVVLRTRRGLEAGRILGALEPSANSSPDSSLTPTPVILRRATLADEFRVAEASRLKPGRLEQSFRLFEDGLWPLVVLDVEPLLDLDRTVIYYFGPHGLETDGLVLAIRDRLGFTPVFEPVGQDRPWDNPLAEPLAESTCGSCGVSGGGGCGAGGGGCSGCALARAVRA